ncbi:DUF2267 domain-containing protein [Candidatus Protochlamydia phocaeensis]|uniref:DUF2267 domain-containing protein n=1 Tax=Candidatus Protochlamydia phocaeensis TaxID=1414722 RepID=UPI0009ABF75D|nr:DUF2267 domain-containing protein [Candidatus Protochlamydia phocaeensis]
MLVEVFETTVQKTYSWLRDLMEILDWNDEHKAYLALRGTLHALRDRLTVNVSVKLSAQLPMLVRGFYFEGWVPATTPVKVKTAEEFFGLASFHFNSLELGQENSEVIVRAVFLLLSQHISVGEINRLKQALPVSIAELWPSSEYKEGQEVLRKEAKHAYRHR